MRRKLYPLEFNSLGDESKRMQLASTQRHSLGEGEVESSILSCSTINSSELLTLFSLNRVPRRRTWTKYLLAPFCNAVVKLRAKAKLKAALLR
jgi:hypothetical protein